MLAGAVSDVISARRLDAGAQRIGALDRVRVHPERGVGKPGHAEDRALPVVRGRSSRREEYVDRIGVSAGRRIHPLHRGEPRLHGRPARGLDPEVIRGEQEEVAIIVPELGHDPRSRIEPVHRFLPTVDQVAPDAFVP